MKNIPECALSQRAPRALLAACYALLSSQALKSTKKEDETLRARYVAPLSVQAH